MPAGNGLGYIFDIGSAFTPVDFNTSDAATGHRVHMRNYDAIAFVIYKGAGTAGADPVITVQEHTAASSGTSTDLAVITEFYKKTETTLDGDETWARVSQAAAATANLGLTTAEEETIGVFQFHAAQLSAGYEWISCNIAATVANAQLVSGLYILTGLKIQREPTELANLNT
jgi:hypothetical protein